MYPDAPHKIPHDDDNNTSLEILILTI